jgi:hypothetical protein
LYGERGPRRTRNTGHGHVGGGGSGNDCVRLLWGEKEALREMRKVRVRDRSKMCWLASGRACHTGTGEATPRASWTREQQ